MKFNLVLKPIFTLLCFGMLQVSTLQAAWVDASVTESLPQSAFALRPGQMRSLYPPGGWRKIHKLFIQADGGMGEATFEVITNGDVKGTIHVPANDPSYVVSVNEVASSIQFRNVSNGTAVIRDVQAVMAKRELTVSASCPDSGPSLASLDQSDDMGLEFTRFESPIDFRETSSRGGHFALRAIQLVDQLEPYANYSEYGNYLLPIKKLAGRAYAYASVRNDLSNDVKCALLTLKRQIDFATPYLNVTFERTAVFELAVELTALGEELKASMWP